MKFGEHAMFLSQYQVLSASSTEFLVVSSPFGTDKQGAVIGKSLGRLQCCTKAPG